MGRPRCSRTRLGILLARPTTNSANLGSPYFDEGEDDIGLPPSRIGPLAVALGTFADPTTWVGRWRLLRQPWLR